MKVLMFMDRFAQRVAVGAKLQTVRPPRKRPIVAGDDLSLRRWTGPAYRSHQVELKRATCIGVDPIELKRDPRMRAMVIIGGRRHLEGTERAHAFVVDDRFAHFSDLVEWFDRQYGLPFKGILIRWAA